jgi:limonene-1,2-epoxide hydrolase
MNTQSQPSPMSVIERLHRAMNQHDLEAFVGCFAPDYRSEQPCHPHRAFVGNEQVRKNWSSLFSSIPDFQSELLRSAVSGDTVWSEWHWHGAGTDSTTFDMRGTIIFGTQNDRIIWGRLYMDPVEEGGAGIDASVKNITEGPQPKR